MKKASANMWWIIIGAVVALVVMIVLMIMFSEGSSKIGKGLLDCGSKGGKCVGENECPQLSAKGEMVGTPSKAFDCEKENGKEQICCFGLEKEQPTG